MKNTFILCLATLILLWIAVITIVVSMSPAITLLNAFVIALVSSLGFTFLFIVVCLIMTYNN